MPAIRNVTLCFVCFFISSLSVPVFAQTRTLRIVEYNIEADVNTYTGPLPGLIAPPTATNNVSAGGVLEGIGEETIGPDRGQPIDVLALEETTSNPSTVTPIVNGLNTVYGVPGMYASSSYQAKTSGGTGGGPNAMVYNTLTVQLLASTPVDPAGGSGQLGGSKSGELREVVRYEFAPAGVAPASSNEFYVYVSHYKASPGAANEAERLAEAQIIRTNEADDLPATARVLYVGDYNVDDSGEAGYQTILAATSPNGITQGQGIDPLNLTNNTGIDWSSSTTDTNILLMLTEHSYNLEYRDDLQVMTTNIYSGAPGGLKYVPGTYHAFGNNGSISYSGSVNSGINTALSNSRLVTNGPVFLNALQIYLDLTDASDHLPLVVDYTIPIPAPAMSSFSLSGTNLALSVTNGITNAVYSVLMQTNLATPLTNWVVLTTNTFATGNFTFTATNAVNAAAPTQFFLLKGK